MRKHLWRSALCGAVAFAFAAFVPAIASAQPEGETSGKQKPLPSDVQSSTGQQQSDVGGSFDEPYLWGAFDSTTATDANDWFYDSYSYDLYQRDWTDVPWYNQPSSFAGLYNDNLPENDWFYDSYAPATGQQNDLFGG